MAVALPVAKRSFINGSGRFTAFTDNRWVTDSDDNFGHNNQNMNENGGTAVDPNFEWEHMGTYLPVGTFLHRLMIAIRTNNNQVGDVEILIALRRPDAQTRYATGFDNDNEMDNVIVQRGLFSDFVSNSGHGAAYAGNSNDMHMAEIPLDALVDRDSMLSMYVRPVGNITANRQIRSTWTYEVSG